MPEAAHSPGEWEEAFVFPLSIAQQRLWILDRLEPGNPFYNVFSAVRLPFAVNPRLVTRCVNQIVRRHETLRSRFGVVDGEPAQIVLPALEVEVPVVSLAGARREEREPRLAALLRDEARRPFDIARAPLFRVLLVEVDSADFVLMVTMYHIVSDGWSLGVFLREFAALYRTGGEATLPELPIQYADFAQWQRETLGGEELERQLAWWRERLAGLPVLELPTDRPRPPQRTIRGARHWMTLAPEVAARARAFGRDHGHTLFQTLLAAFAVLLAKTCDQEDVVVGSPVAGRSSVEVEPLIGFFVNTLVLRIDLAGDPAFGEAARRVQEGVLGAFAHQDVPFEMLVERLQPERDLSRSPLFQVVFQLLNVPVGEGAGAGAGPGLEVDRGASAFDLTLDLWERGEEIDARFEFNTDLFDRASIERMGRRYERVLSTLAGDPSRRLSDLCLMDDGEREAMSRILTGPVVPPEDGAAVHALIEAQAARAPDAPALDFGDGPLTYRELDARANRLAHLLRARGVAPGDRVALCLARTSWMVVAMLASWKAGAAYVPLDPAYPAARLRFMLEDSGAAVLIDDAGVLDGPARVLALEEARRELEQSPDRSPEVPPAADRPAYVLYTSGSTGRPKGVVVPHRGLVNVACAQREVFRVGPGDRVLQFASMSFDASAFELMMALASGATAVSAPKEQILPGPDLARFLADRGVTIVTLPPSSLAALPRVPLPALRTVTVAGEPCPEELAHAWGAGRELYNLYGPTECSIWSTWARCRPGEPVTIGGPIANTALSVVDRWRVPVPPGIPGELVVGGSGVASGYAGPAELGAERFVAGETAGLPGHGRVFRTGDRVKCRQDGALEFIGRLDGQVKVRGVRVELGEIERCLEQAPGVLQAAVVWVPDGGGRVRAFAVAEAAGPEVADELRAWLRTRLPEAMIPADLALLEALPVAPGGKVDRQALARMPMPSSEAVRDEPAGEMERIVAEAWAAALGRRDFGAGQNFFDVGGNSLLVIKVHEALEGELGRRIPVLDLFRFPTVRSFAAHVEEGEPRPAAPQAVESRSAPLEEAPPPAVPAPRDLKGRTLDRAARIRAALAKD